MKELYLIRKNLEKILGPYEIGDVAIALRKMQISLTDEIAGSCGPWVSFENRGRLEQIYPNLGRNLRDILKGLESLAGKGEMGQFVSNDVDTRNEYGVIRQTWWQKWKYFVPVFIGLFVVAGLLIEKQFRFASRSYYLDNTTAKLSDVTKLLEQDQYALFFQTMDDVVPQLNERFLQTREGVTEWLPLLRAYVFLGGAHPVHIPTKTLRGGDYAGPPTDCSQRIWNKRWRESADSWKDFLSGKKIGKGIWSKTLLWDLNWIRRRSDSGWIRPVNFYGACLQSAFRAYREIKFDELNDTLPVEQKITRDEFDSIGKRMQFLSEGSLSQTSSLPALGDNTREFLWTLSCMEYSNTYIQLQSCYDNALTSNEFKNYIEYRFIWNMVRLFINNPALIQDEDKLNMLKERVNKILKMELGFSKTDYRFELKTFRDLFRTKTISPDLEAGLRKLTADSDNE